MMRNISVINKLGGALLAHIKNGWRQKCTVLHSLILWLIWGGKFGHFDMTKSFPMISIRAEESRLSA